MTTTSTGTSNMRKTFFRYLRPAVNGFGASDEPDPEVAKALDELVELLEKGFVDKGNKDDDRLASLINKLKTLEDESRNGTNEANEKLKNEINKVKEATQIVAVTESQAQIFTREISDAKELLNSLLNKLPSNKDNKTDQDTGAEKSKVNQITPKKDSIEDQIKAVRACLLEKQRQQEIIEEE